MDRVQIITFSANFITIFKNLISYAIIARILLSWFSPMGAPRGRFSQLLYDITDPFLNLAKKIPHRIGMIDLSPLIALIGIDLLSYFIVNLLYKLA